MPEFDQLISEGQHDFGFARDAEHAKQLAARMIDELLVDQTLLIVRSPTKPDFVLMRRHDRTLAENARRRTKEETD